MLLTSLVHPLRQSLIGCSARQAAAVVVAAPVSLVRGRAPFSTSTARRSDSDSTTSDSASSAQQPAGNLSPVLTPDMARAIQETHLSFLTNPHMLYHEHFNEIKAAEDVPFALRWQKAMHLFVMSQVHALLPFGYSGDDKGLRRFTEDFETLLRGDSSGELVKQVQKRHTALVSAAFGVDLKGETIPLEKVRELSAIIAGELSAADFTSKAKEEADKASSQEQKHQALSTLILDKQMEVVGRHGFEGTEGFLQYQCSIMHYGQDQEVAYNNVSGIMPVYRAAGISLGGQ